MNTITPNELAIRIAIRINSKTRKDREFTKADFSAREGVPQQIYNEFVEEFPSYSQQELNDFTKELTKLVEA